MILSFSAGRAAFLKKIAAKFKNDKFATAVLVACAFFVYSNALLNNFVWDDEEQVVNNTVIRDWGNLPLAFKSSTFYGGGAGLSGGFYRPLVTFSYFWNYSYWGLNPFGYHLMQLFFHCANAILVFLILKKVFENEKEEGRLIAFAAALIFCVHPANVESVAYVASIGEVFYVFFILFAFLIFTKSFAGGRLNDRRYFWGSFGLFFLGFLAKETAVIILLLMAIYLFLFVRPQKSVYFKFIIGAVLPVSFYSFLRFCVADIAPVSKFLAPIHLAPLWQRLLTVPYEIISYLGIIIFPNDLSVSRHFVVTSAMDPRFWGSIIALALAGAGIIYFILKTKSRIFIFFAFWFVIALAPVLNIVSLDMTIAERWLYFPIIGFLAAACFAIADNSRKLSSQKQKIVLISFMVIAAVFGIRTINRNIDWKNGLSLYGHDIELVGRLSPQGSFDLENNYGVELFRAGRFAQAQDHFRKSVALQPDWALSQNNLGAVLEQNHDLDSALAQYRKSAEMGYYRGYENVVAVLIKTKRYDEAKMFLKDALLKLPENEKLLYDVALLYSADNIGNDKDAKQKAIYDLELILQADPQNKQAAQLYLMLQTGRRIEL